MGKEIKIAVILSAMDKMSGVVGNAVSKSNDKLASLSRKSAAFGAASLAAAGTVGAAMYAGPIKAYATLEEASLALKSQMLQDGNIISGQFGKVEELAISLGNKYKGNTADFTGMMVELLRNGTTAEDILNGTGKATALFATELGMSYDEAARFSSKLAKAANVGGKEMVQFLDVISRTRSVGVDATEMQYAFAKSSASLQQMGLAGLEGSKGVSALYAMLIRTGETGETVGTNMSKVFETLVDETKMKKFNAALADVGAAPMKFTDKRGDFIGIPAMLQQMDRLKALNLSDAQMVKITSALTGGGSDSRFIQTFIGQGSKGYNAIIKQMAEQATLTDKAEQKLTGLSAMWEAATGTFENMNAALGETLAPELKSLTESFGRFSESAIKFIKEHPRMVKAVMIIAGGFVALATVMGGISMAVSAVSSVMSAFSAIGSAFAGITAAGIASAVAIGAVVLAVVGIAVYWKEFNAWFDKQPRWMRVTMKLFLSPFFLAAATVRAVVKLLTGDWRGALDEIVGAVKKFSIWGMIWNALVKAWNVMIRWGKSTIDFFGMLWIRVKLATLDALGALWDGIVGFMSRLATKMLQAGKNLVYSIARGIKEAAKEALSEMSDLTTKLRSYLPFSPAKAGALRDLNKVRIVETIAERIKPTPIVKAMSRVAMAGMVAAGPFAGNAAASPSSGNVRPSGGNSGAVVVNYSPTITLAGGSSKDDIQALLKQHSDEIVRMIEQKQQRSKRLEY